MQPGVSMMKWCGVVIHTFFNLKKLQSGNQFGKTQIKMSLSGGINNAASKDTA